MTPSTVEAPEVTLAVRDLKVHIRRGSEVVKAVDGLSYEVGRGRALAIVGESGSGKTVGARALLGLLPKAGRIESGQAVLAPGSGNGAGTDLLGLSGEQLRNVRGRDVAMVFQNAMEAMNPTVTVKRQLTEHLLWHRICDKREAVKRAVAALGDVGIPEPERRLRMYPFQLSGGMRQRVMIAMAMVTKPRLLIADEPTTAVDVTVQRQLIDLLRGVKETGTSIILITHDLGVAKALCDDILVMYAGRQMEFGATEEVVRSPLHPYTAGLIGSSVEVGQSERELRPIPGVPPDLARLPGGCSFRTRCALATTPECEHEQELVTISRPTREKAATGPRAAACWRVEADAR